MAQLTGLFRENVIERECGLLCTLGRASAVLVSNRACRCGVASAYKFRKMMVACFVFFIENRAGPFCAGLLEAQLDQHLVENS